MAYFVGASPECSQLPMLKFPREPFHPTNKSASLDSFLSEKTHTHHPFQCASYQARLPPVTRCKIVCYKQLHLYEIRPIKPVIRFCQTSHIHNLLRSLAFINLAKFIFHLHLAQHESTPHHPFVSSIWHETRDTTLDLRGSWAFLWEWSRVHSTPSLGISHEPWTGLAWEEKNELDP